MPFPAVRDRLLRSSYSVFLYPQHPPRSTPSLQWRDGVDKERKRWGGRPPPHLLLSIFKCSSSNLFLPMAALPARPKHHELRRHHTSQSTSSSHITNYVIITHDKLRRHHTSQITLSSHIIKDLHIKWKLTVDDICVSWGRKCVSIKLVKMTDEWDDVTNWDLSEVPLP